MSGRICFVCLLHSHQPVGNFDGVIEDAYKQSYLPYIEVFEQYPQIALTNHFSGCLLEWFEKHHPEYLDRLARNVAPASNRHAWEMMGGGFYEPIMPMLPDRDRLGQIARMQQFLEKRFGAKPRGLWLPERVWEPALVKDLVDAGAEYLTLDDSHFKAAGLDEKALVGGFLAEDQGRVLTAYPASERLRYLIPFKPVHDCINYLRSLVPPDGDRVVCYADDGEKFGVWPMTHQHVYRDGWLKHFLDAIRKAQEEGWLVSTTLGEAFDEVEPVGPLCLPENSYREMTEWVLPARRLAGYESALHSIQNDPVLAHDARIKSILPQLRGGNWRAFKVKYAEAGRMYAKMMEVSAKVAALPEKAKLRDKAQTHLYRGQCNCPYWHGIFGGLYLPHLRSAVYSELIKADKLADEMAEAPAIQLEARDFDFDGEPEVKLANPHVALYLHPRRGGHLYEFDLRDIDFNVGDTFSRRFEAYHEKVARAIVGDGAGTASIHEVVRAKEAGLAALLKYDTYLRESLVDHLSAEPLTPEAMLSGAPPSDPEFRTGRYEIENGDAAPGARRRTEKGAAIALVRRAPWGGGEVQVSKHVSLRGKPEFEVEYVVENVGAAALAGFFGVEMNYSLLAGNAHDRYYYHPGAENAGMLATVADFGALPFVGLKDHWLNVALTLRASVPAQVLVSPVRTVSQSEGGFESVYQSSCVVLQWLLRLAPAQSFRVSLRQEIGRA